MCQSHILSSKGPVIISQCVDCKMLNIWLRNLLLNFTPEQFCAFENFISKLAIDEYTFPFPDGEERLVLRTPNNDICFTFTAEEWDDFKIAMEEAAYMQGVYALLLPK